MRHPPSHPYEVHVLDQLECELVDRGIPQPSWVRVLVTLLEACAACELTATPMW